MVDLLAQPGCRSAKLARRHFAFYLALYVFPKGRQFVLSCQFVGDKGRMGAADRLAGVLR